MRLFHQFTSVLKLMGMVLALIGLFPDLPGVVQASHRPAPVASSADLGIIAYVRRSTHDIHLLSPDGTTDRVLWTAPQPHPLFAAQDFAWRPDGRELAFSSEHEETCSWYQSHVYAIRYNGTGYRHCTNSPTMPVGLPRVRSHQLSPHLPTDVGPSAVGSGLFSLGPAQASQRSS